ncbi:MAG TPA: hypothetical protein PK957_02425 [Candidatus Dojkabacteria bacterium]|nr:hypothetical protein [Candidatus Dojkabacteria bacterium]HQF36371.1 hypothetical protein [Candidatus Dojkabacteria bacterium]
MEPQNINPKTETIVKFILKIIIIFIPLSFFTPVFRLNPLRDFFTANNWKILYSIGLICSILSPIIMSFAIWQNIKQKNKKIVMKKNLSEFTIILVIWIYYILMLIYPSYNDLKKGLIQTSGICYVEKIYNLHYFDRVLVINDDGKKLNISSRDYNELKGMEIGTDKYLCKNRVIVLYTPYSKQVISIQNHEQNQ